MYVALTCQKDLDSLIQLLNDTGSKRAHIYIRLFEEPPSVSSVSSVFIQSPEAQSEMRVCFWTASLWFIDRDSVMLQHVALCKLACDLLAGLSIRRSVKLN